MLPTEIFEAIIDQTRDDTISLRRLSLACHVFLPRARYHLFSTIVLHTPQRVDSFRDLLNTHPWVGPLVQALVHSSVDPVSDYIFGASIDIDVAVPLHLLSRLPNLHTWRMGIPELGEGQRAVWLQSGHRPALSSCPSYNSHVRNLEVALVFFKDILAFMELVSTFTGIHTLTCSAIQIKSSVGIGLERRSASQLRSLRLSTSVDIRVVGYLLSSSRTRLNDLALTFDHPKSPRYLEQLEVSVGGLSRLSSLRLTIPSHRTFGWGNERDDVSEVEQFRNIRAATRLIKSMESVHVQDVQVDFKPGPIASIGSCLASGPLSMDLCKTFEDSLLTFPRSCIRFHDEGTSRRAGRLEFWSAAIKRAFPRLSERGLLLFPDPKSNTLDPVGHESSVKCLVTSLHGQCVATASDDGTIIVWDAARRVVSQEWLADRGGVFHLALSPDGQQVVSLGRSRSKVPTVWDITNDVRKAAVLEGHTEVVTACAWSPDGTLIASTSPDGTVRIWDAQTFEQRDLLEDPGHASGYLRILFSPDSRHLVAWMPQLPKKWIGLVIWRPLTGEPPTRLPPISSPIGLSDRIEALSFDTQSRRIVTARGSESGESVIRVWDVATGAALKELVGPRGLPTDVSFSPDGRSILSVSCDGFAQIWNAKNRRGKTFVGEGRGHTDMVRARLSPNGKYVVTSTWASEVQLWRTDDGSCAAMFTEHKTRVLHVAFSSDGEYLASGDLDGVVYIRRLSGLVGP